MDSVTNKILGVMVLAIIVLVLLNIRQCNKNADIKDAELDAVSLERIQQAWDETERINKLWSSAQDSLDYKDSVIAVISRRRPKRTHHYDTIYFGISSIPTDERYYILADRRDYLVSLRERRFPQ